MSVDQCGKRKRGLLASVVKEGLARGPSEIPFSATTKYALHI